MKTNKFLFSTNLVLTLMSIIASILIDKINSDYDGILFSTLPILGLYQLITSLPLTFNARHKSKNLLLLYLVYWCFVVAFLMYMLANGLKELIEYGFGIYFFSCIPIAIYNVYVNYCSFLESKKTNS